MPLLTLTLSPANTQKLHEALLCLSKFSEYVSLEARRHTLCLSALNSTRSAAAAIHLAANRFFDSYHFVLAQGSDLSQEGNEAKFTCRLQTKALLAVFRQRYLDTKDKSTAIDRCELRIDTLTPSTPTRPECRVLARLICKHGVIKTHKLTYEEVDVMHAIFTRATQPHHWRLSSILLKEFMEHFAPKAEQLDISTANGRAAFTSFTEKLIDGKEILKQPLQTSVALDTSDFDEFRVEDNLHIAVSLKDFKAIAAHAASVEVPVDVYYSQSGKPLQVHYMRDGMECEFTLMTASDTRSSQAFGAMGRVMPIPRPAPAGGSQQGREATEEEWGQQVEGQQSQTGNQRQSQLTPELPNLTAEDESPHKASTPTPQPAPTAPKQELEPPILDRPNRPDVPLFLDYSEDEDEDDDLGMGLDNERSGFSLGWDTSGQELSQPVTTRTRSRTNHYTDEDEEEETGVGPTPQSNVPKGLFD